MRLPSWIRNIRSAKREKTTNRAAKRTTLSGQRRNKGQFRPVMEVLEERRLLSGLSVANGGGLAAAFVGPNVLVKAAGFGSSAPPVVTAPVNQAASEGASTSFNLGSFSDPDSGPYQVDVKWGDGTPDTIFSVAGSSANNVSLGAKPHAYAETGTENVTVQVTNSAAQAASASFHVTVADVPLSSVLGVPVTATEATPTGTITVATFTDGGNPSNTVPADYSASITWGDGGASPGSFVYDTVHDVWDVQGSHAYDDEGTYAVHVTINDGPVNSVTASSTATVADAPLTNVAGVPITATEGASTGTVTVATFVDPGNPDNTLESDYSALITWGFGKYSTGSFVYDTTNNVWEVQVSYTFAEAGIYHFAVVISDGDQAVGVSSTATVADVPLTDVTGVPVAATEGASTGPVTVATFVDGGNPSNTPQSDYSAVINWGDGSTSPDGFVYDSTHHVWDVQGTHAYSETGSYSISVTINDGLENSVTASSTATVADVPLTSVTGVPVNATEGAPTGPLVVATFIDGGNPLNTLQSDYIASITWGDGSTSPGNFVYDATNNVWDVQGSHTYAEAGSDPISVTINDGPLNSATAGSTATVADVPLTGVTGVPVAATEASSTGVVTVATFTDGGNPSNTLQSDYSASIAWGDGGTSPGSFVYDATNNVWDVQGSHTYAEAGSDSISVTINDGPPNSASAGSTATVADVPLTGVAGVAVAATEASSTGPVTVATFIDGGNPSNTLQSDYSASITWGDGGTSPGSFVYDAAHGVWDVEGSHTYAEAGSDSISVTINDGPLNSATASSTATVADVPLTNVTGVAVSATEASSTGPVTVATFIDGGNPSNALQSDYSASIAWGDGSTSPGSFVYDATNNVWDVEGSHTYAEAGSDPISVTVNDGPTNSATASSTATVADVPLTDVTGVAVSATEASSTGPVTVATFIDGGNPSNTLQSDYSASIAWGDGGTSPGSFVYDTSHNVWDVEGSHTYAEAGSDPISVTINDGPTNSATASSTATVADVPLTNVTGVAVSATEASSTGPVTVATFTDGGNPSNTLQSDYSASIAWGDGGTSPGSFVYDAAHNVWDVKGSHTYAEAGSDPISVTINDGPANSASASGTATVADVPLTNVTGVAVSATEASSTGPVTVATFTDGGNPSNTLQPDYSASIAWGDGSTSPGSFVYDAAHHVWDVEGSHTYAEAGSDPISVTINDGPTNSATASSTATVADVPLTNVAGVAVAATEASSTGPVTVATFTDGGNPSNSLQSDYSASITWGDGGTSPGSFVYDAAHHVWDVRGSHTYAEAGSDPISVTINDGPANSASASSTATVADVPLTSVTGVAVVATEASSTGPVTVATFTDGGNPSNTLQADYSASIAWGDGGTSPGSFVYDAAHHVWDVRGSHTYAEAGSDPISVTINDGPANSASASSTATVADVPLTSVTGVTVAATEASSTGVVTVATFIDAGNPSNTLQADYSASIAWGDGGTSSGSFVYDTAHRVWDVRGSHTYTDAGSDPISVTINDGPANSATASSTATVADVPLTSVTGVAVNAKQGQSTGPVTVATFIDGGNPSNTLQADYSASIAWGDGGTSPGSFVYDAAHHVWDVQGSYTYTAAGSFPVHVTINDGPTNSATASSTATVINANVLTPFQEPLETINTYEGTSWSYQLAGAFTDAIRSTPTSAFSGTINWGDGTTTAFTNGSGNVSLLFSDATSSHYAVSGVHAYAEEGAYQITVTINDNTGSSVTVHDTNASVGDAPLSAHPVTVPSGTAIAGNSFTTTVAKFTDMDPNAVAQFTTENSAGQPGDYTATINWGDGTTSVVTNLTPQATIGNIVVDGSGFDVVGTHMYNPSTATSYNVTVSIADVGGSKASTSTTILDPPAKTVKASASVNDAALIAVLGGSNGSSANGSTSNKALNPVAVALLYSTNRA